MEIIGTFIIMLGLWVIYEGWERWPRVIGDNMQAGLSVIMMLVGALIVALVFLLGAKP